LRRRPMARQAAGLNRRDHPLAKINRVRFAHPCWPPFPASMLNQNPPDFGILNRFRLNSYRSKCTVAKAATEERLGSRSLEGADSAATALSSVIDD
jgi:hypothetical protein